MSEEDAQPCREQHYSCQDCNPRCIPLTNSASILAAIILGRGPSKLENVPRTLSLRPASLHSSSGLVPNRAPRVLVTSTVVGQALAGNTGPAVETASGIVTINRRLASEKAVKLEFPDHGATRFAVSRPCNVHHKDTSGVVEYEELVCVLY